MALQFFWGRNAVLAIGRAEKFLHARSVVGAHVISGAVRSELRHDSSRKCYHGKYGGVTKRREFSPPKDPLRVLGLKTQSAHVQGNAYASASALRENAGLVRIGDILASRQLLQLVGSSVRYELPVSAACKVSIDGRTTPKQVRFISTKRRRYFKMRKFHKKKYKKILMRSNKVPFVDIDKPKRTWKTLREIQLTRKTFRRGVPGKGARMLRLKRQR